MSELLLRGRAASTRRRVRWSAIAKAALAVVVVGTLTAQCWPRPEIPCAVAVREKTMDVAVVVCQREYSRTGEPAVGALLAELLWQQEQPASASAIATSLLSTPERANALYTLAKIAFDDGDLRKAEESFQEARRLHKTAGQRDKVAKANQALVGVFLKQERYAEALRVLDDCLVETKAIGHRTYQLYCHITAAKVLSDIGNFDQAEKELADADKLISGDRDLAAVELERGNLHQEVIRAPLRRDHAREAIGAFERSLEAAERARLQTGVRGARANLAYSYAEQGKLTEAEQQLAKARALDSRNIHEVAYTLLDARIAYRRGDLSRAYALNARVYEQVEDEDDQIDVCAMQARIALERDDLEAAERWARKGIERAELVRSAQAVVELRPWILSQRREPYQLLFVTHARAGQAEDALLVLERWHGRTVVDAMARPSSPSADLLGAANRVDSLSKWLPIVSSAPMVSPRDRDKLRAGLRQIDLLALALAEGEIWVLAASSGQLTIRSIGAYAELEERLANFKSHPEKPELAEALGELILRDGSFRATRKALYVILDGPLAPLPIVALRRGGVPLIAARPVVRAVRIPEQACIPAAAPRRMRVLADPHGDLPRAHEEVSEIARLLAVEPIVGAGATSKAMFATRDDEAFHAAMHGGLDVGGGVLKLHDRLVSALEISARGFGPALVVLSACDSATARDDELAGSLSSAFLSGGSTHVIATLRPVTDRGALEIMKQFYRTGGVTDPVRSLARIQASLADSKNPDWANFAVFGHDVCTP